MLRLNTTYFASLPCQCNICRMRNLFEVLSPSILKTPPMRKNVFFEGERTVSTSFPPYLILMQWDLLLGYCSQTAEKAFK